jgi:SAM-dependent methyltransferase
MPPTLACPRCQAAAYVRLVTEAARVLRPGGLFVAGEWGHYAAARGVSGDEAVRAMPARARFWDEVDAKVAGCVFSCFLGCGECEALLAWMGRPVLHILRAAARGYFTRRVRIRSHTVCIAFGVSHNAPRL